MVLNMIPSTAMMEEGGQALCSDSQIPMSWNNHPSLQKSLSALSGGATPIKIIQVVGTQTGQSRFGNTSCTGPFYT